MIKPTYFIITILIAAFIAVLLVMQSAGSVVPLTNDQNIISPSDTPDRQVEPVKAQDDTSMLPAPTPKLVSAQVTPPLDGRSVLEDHCVNCHEVQWLEKIKKTRPEWEKTLGVMKQVGVRLSDTEKDALLNYLEPIE